MSLERLIVSGAVNLVRRWVSSFDGRRATVDHAHQLEICILQQL